MNGLQKLSEKTKVVVVKEKKPILAGLPLALGTLGFSSGVPAAALGYISPEKAPLIGSITGALGGAAYGSATGGGRSALLGAILGSLLGYGGGKWSRSIYRKANPELYKNKSGE